MSIIIALKFNKGIIIAADKQVSYGNLKEHNAVKIFKSKYSNTAIGIGGDGRGSDIIYSNVDELIEYKDILDKIKIDYKYVVNNIVNNIFHILDKNGNLYKENNTVSCSNELLIISDEKIFHVFSNGALIECNSFGVIGCGYQLVKGYLDGLRYNPDVLEEKEAKSLIETCIKDCCKDDVYIDDNIDYICLYKEEE